MEVENLLRQGSVLWRGGALYPDSGSGIATGFPSLDRHLAGRGWPRQAVIEILSSRPGGAMLLLMPALATLSREAKQIVLIAPPYIPYAPGFSLHGVDLTRLLLVKGRDEKECLWVLEQVLGAGCGAAVYWPQRLSRIALRRLQLAAERGGGSGFLLRRPELIPESTSAALRLRVAAAGDTADILKRRGGWPVEGIRLDGS
ncbi:MAG: translesion DNA synthesis-associated protein ImuA [Gammaproteobacteria bacterium]|nr:translesion DNA synthesis-associated protein ImuA [Gammaproteobacteria bacterium]HXK57628.1 translesion DNA synthesis-associated protein ImuA [Gammaproteobacteria bacterium]